MKTIIENLGGGYVHVSTIYYGIKLERTMQATVIAGWHDKEIRQSIIKYHKKTK